MVGARDEVFGRLFRGGFLANAACILARGIDYLRPFFCFIKGRMPPIASKGSRSGDRVAFLCSNGTGNRIFLCIREGVIFKVLYQFSILVHVSARGKGITNIAQPRPIIDVHSGFSGEEEENACRAGITVRNFCGRVVFVSSVGNFRFRLNDEDCFGIFYFYGAFYCFIRMDQERVVDSFQIFIFL